MDITTLDICLLKNTVDLGSLLILPLEDLVLDFVPENLKAFQPLLFPFFCGKDFSHQFAGHY